MQTLAMGLTSTWYEEPMKSTPKKSSKVLFNTFGAPPVVYKSDNGSPFQSHQVQRVCEEMGGFNGNMDE